MLPLHTNSYGSWLMSQASMFLASQAFLVKRRDVKKEEEGEKSKRGNVYYLLPTITTDQVCFKFREHLTASEDQESGNRTIPRPSKTKHSSSALLALQIPVLWSQP